MKSYFKFLIIFLSLAFCMNIEAASNSKYFDSLSDLHTFNYTYISPVMLKAMNGQMLDSQNYGSLPINTNDLTSIEIISTSTNGTDEKLWKIIRDLKNSKKMETLSTKKKGNYRYDILARLSGDNKYITNLMVVTQNTGSNVSVVYMEGKIPVNCLHFSYDDDSNPLYRLNELPSHFLSNF